MIPRICISLCAFFAVASGLALAQNPEPNLQLIKSTQVIEEIVYPIQIFAYQPLLDLSAAVAKRSGTPEAVVAGWTTAMRNGDYDAAIRYWDAESGKMIEDRNRKEGKSQESWRSSWKRLFDGNTVRASKQVRRGPMILIGYEIVNPQGSVVNSEVVALRKTNDNWQLTLQYADHAVMQGWNRPDVRVRRLARD